VDKSLILAVAGSGKTTLLVERLDLQKRTLVITYTENNYRNLHRKITNRFGHLPSNIRLQTYFTFINSFCYRPYLLLPMNSKGITFDPPRGRSMYAPSSSHHRYLDSTNRVYHGRMADLLDVKGCMPELLKRLRRYFDALYVDEVQDLGGYDFNFLLALCRAELEVLLVGDFYQHTYSTSADGAVNKNLYRELEKYKARIRSAGLKVDSDKLLHSRRCSIEVCQFIQDHLGIEIASGTGKSSKVAVVDNKTEIDRKRSVIPP
jgi:DNA helicase II / ATP-dependent DNA helicase PcrA